MSSRGKRCLADESGRRSRPVCIPLCRQPSSCLSASDSSRSSFSAFLSVLFLPLMRLSSFLLSPFRRSPRPASPRIFAPMPSTPDISTTSVRRSLLSLHTSNSRPSDIQPGLSVHARISIYLSISLSVYLSVCMVCGQTVFLALRRLSTKKKEGRRSRSLFSSLSLCLSMSSVCSQNFPFLPEVLLRVCLVS